MSTRSRTASKRKPESPKGSDRAMHAAPMSKWEWVFAGAGLLLVLGMVGYIAYYALTAEATVAAVTIDHVATETTPGGYVLRFRARNLSGSTAAALRIAGELRQGTSIVEASEAVLDYLPPFSERRGGLFFQEDPSRYELRLYPRSYVEP